MKIVHLCLSSFYIDNYNYQENALPKQNRADGHEVVIIASTFSYIDNIGGGYVSAGEYINEDGIRVIRLPYRTLLPVYLMSKIRAYPGVDKLLEQEKPDVILFHGSSSWEIMNVAKYKRKHPGIKFYVDSHADDHNSATNFISNHFLHQVFYRTIIQRSLPYIDKMFYLSYECGDFLRKRYLVPEAKTEFYPLGGVIFSDHIYQEKRQKIRRELGLDDNTILCVHSGKMDWTKRTAEMLQAFSRVGSDNMRLLLAGSLAEDYRQEVESLIAGDPRVSFAGWKTADELMEYLCAADVYVQPGGQSATMQNAICCGCAMVLFAHKSHEPYLQGNGYYVKTIDDMQRVFQEIADSPGKLKEMSDNSMKVARELLDYKKLAARLYE